ncbi:hypothetical protein [Klebsiella pneumoniae]|uniref:hypothetical protein n=1 Tax=Klebsiella pneumoniae TaxID=573 RepID=UPI001D0ED891|nr:hypothetical protein [Klebsiella pneumoniae]
MSLEFILNLALVRGFLLPAARDGGAMTTAIEYGNPDLWLVLLMLAAGVVSSALLSETPINPRRLIGDVLRGVIVAIILWAYGAMGNISILNVITLAGLSAVAWPHTVNEITGFAKRTISRIFGGRKER